MKRFELYYGYGYNCPVGPHSWYSNALFLFSRRSKAAPVSACCPAHGNPQINTIFLKQPTRIYWIENEGSMPDDECYELDMFENWVNEVRKEAGL